MDLTLSLGTCRTYEPSWDAQEMIAHWEEGETGLFAWLSLWITDLLMCCILSVSSSHTVTTAKTNHPRSLRHTRIHSRPHGTPTQIQTTLPVATHLSSQTREFFTFSGETGTGPTSSTVNTALCTSDFNCVQSWGSLDLLWGSLEVSQFTVFSSTLSHGIIYGLVLHKMTAPEGNSENGCYLFSCCWSNNSSICVCIHLCCCFRLLLFPVTQLWSPEIIVLWNKVIILTTFLIFVHLLIKKYHHTVHNWV